MEIFELTALPIFLRNLMQEVIIIGNFAEVLAENQSKNMSK